MQPLGRLGCLGYSWGTSVLAVSMTHTVLFHVLVEDIIMFKKKMKSKEHRSLKGTGTLLNKQQLYKQPGGENAYNLENNNHL